MRFWARIDFRLYAAFNPGAEWDPDNLLKAFFDALADAGFFGEPAIAASSMKGDERVDYWPTMPLPPSQARRRSELSATDVGVQRRTARS